MGDRTNIAVTQPHLTPKGAECGYVAVAPLAGGGWLCMKCGASGLRADPDTSDELFTEARRLLDAATPGPWEQWEAYEVRSFGPTLIASTNGRTDNSQAVADAELIAAAPRLIAALLAERDAERAARERAETEARQLREAIRVQAERPIPTLPSHWSADEKVGYRSGWDDRTEHIHEVLAFYDAPAAVAEGAEDRGQTDG